MADNYNDYFVSRISETDQYGGNTKFAAVQQASKDKIAQLAKMRDEQALAEKQARATFAASLGLEYGDTGFKAANTVASLASGVTRIAGSLAASPFSLVAGADQSNLSEADIAALGRYSKGEHTDADMAQISRKVAPKVPTGPAMPNAQANAQALADANPNAPTPLKIWDEMNKARTASRAITKATDISSIVDQTDRNAFNADLSNVYTSNKKQVAEGWDGLVSGKDKLGGSVDLVAGIAKLIGGAGVSVATNKQAVLEYITENAPQLFIGAAGKAGAVAQLVDNFSNAADSYNKGIQKYQAENNGALPSADQRKSMAAYMVAHAGAEQLGDKIGLAATKLAGQSVDTARTSFIKALKGTAGAAGEGVVSEAPTEAFQQFAEGQMTGTPATGAEIFTAGVIGGASGAGLSGGGRGVHEAAKLLVQPSASKPSVDVVSPALSKTVDAAIASGDVAGLVDPKAKTYAPDKAIGALFGHSQLETTTPEQKQANLGKAEQILSDLMDKQNAQEQDVATSTVIGTRKLLDGFKAQLAAIDPASTDATDVKRRESLDTMVSVYQEQLDAFKDTPENAKQAASAKAALDQTNILLAAATRNHKDLTELVNPMDEVAQLVSLASAKKDATNVESSQAAAQKLLVLAMKSPESLDPKEAARMADDADNSLLEPQRAYLRAFSEARIAENSLRTPDKVLSEILNGSPKGTKNPNVGITQYQGRMATALAAGNRAQADKVMTGLVKFMDDNVIKAQMVTDSVAKIAAKKTGGKAIQLLKDATGSWFINPGAEKDREEVKANGGLTLHSGTPPSLAPSVSTGAKALQAAVAELRAAYEIKFNSPVTTGAANVTDVSKESGAATQLQGKSTQSEQPANNQTVAKASTSGDASTAVPSTGTTGQVESTGVVTSTEEAIASSVSTKESKTTESSAVDSQSTQESTSAVVTKADSKPTENVVEVQAVPEEAPSATTNKPYQQKDLVAESFTQSGQSTTDGTGKPLVLVKDFISQVASGAVELATYLKDGAPTDPQIAAWRAFTSFASKWSPNILANLIRDKNPAYFYEDLMQFLVIGEKGDKLNLAENVKTAMSYAAFGWVAEKASGPSFNSDAEINAILGRDETHPVTDEEKKALLFAGIRQNLVLNSLGQKAIQALGYKLRKDAPRAELAKLESALGAHIFKLLLDQGIIQQNVISGEKMKSLTGSEATDTNVDFTFIKFARNKEGALNTAAQEIMASVKGSGSVLDKLFSVESGLKWPSSTPVSTLKQSKAKNSKQDIPAKLKEVLEITGSTGHYLRQDMWRLMDLMSDDIALEIAGAQHVEGVHAAKIPNIEAANEGLMRELAYFKEYFGEQANQDKLEDPLYFEPVVWKQQRVGLGSNTINPQTSKIHRHMLFQKTWETVVDSENDEQMDNFFLRVGEGLGVKTDKQSNEWSMDMVVDKVESPEVKAAVAVLVQSIHEGTDMTPEMQATLLAGVKYGKQKMHSLDALTALAEYEYATRGGPSSFTVRMVGEVDGVTNGPMLSHLLLGAANSSKELLGLVNRGGFFEEGNKHTQYNQWHGDTGNHDLYENTIRNVMSKVNDLLQVPGKKGIDGSLLASVSVFTGSLVNADTLAVEKDGRDIIKTPLTAMVFGSSPTKAIDSMADKFVSSIYSKIESLSANKAGVTRDSVIGNLNTLLGKALSVPADTTVEQLMAMDFSAGSGARFTALKQAFKNTLGKAVKETMESDFSVFMAQRTQFNTAAQVTFGLFSAAYQGLREELIKELVSKGELAVNGVGKPIQDLSKAQEAELGKRLRDLTPLMHTLMSQDSGTLNAGLRMAKSAKELSKNSLYQGRVKFGSPLKGTKVWSKTQKKWIEQTGLSTHGFEQVETAPGVAMAPMSVHSMDSAISHYAAVLGEVLNIHDAHGTGLGNFQKTAQNLNQATWNALLNYSPATQVSNALLRTVHGMADMVRNGTLPDSSMKYLADALTKAMGKDFEGTPAEFLQYTLSATQHMAFNADSIKLDVLSQLQSIDQYALEGGNYPVTDKDRAEASSKKTALVDAMQEQDKEALAVIMEALEKGSSEKPAVEVKSTSPDFFGKVGKATVQSDPELVTFFNDNPKATAKQVIEFLFRKLSGEPNSKNQGFNLKLLRMLSKVVNPELTINLVTADTKEADVIGSPTGPTLGWYASLGAQEAIYITGTDFTHSNIQVEVLLHELTHAATMYRLSTSTGKQQLAALTELLTKVREHTKNTGNTNFDMALESVDEMVAYGMTSPPFQKLLSAVEAGQTTTKANGWEKFLQVLSKLLGFADIAAAKGLGVLITNVAALFEQGAEEQTRLANRKLSIAPQMAIVNTYSTMDIFNALNVGGITTAFQEHLTSLLNGIVDRMHGPYGAFKESFMKDQALTPMDVWRKALTTGVAPFASKIQTSGFQMNDQVLFAIEQVEVTVRAALDTNDAATKEAYKELVSLYSEMRTTLSPSSFHDGDWKVATPNEKAKAQALYDFVFKLEKTNGDRSDYLSRFAALGLAHPQVNKLMQVAANTVNTKDAPKNMGERLQRIFESILEYFHSKITRTYKGQQADERLNALVNNLVDIEAKRKAVIAHRMDGSVVGNVLDAGTSVVRYARRTIRNTAGSIAESNFIQNNRSKFVTGVGDIVSTIANKRIDEFMEALSNVYESQSKDRDSLLNGFLNELRGPKKELLNRLRDVKHKLENLRKNAITTATRMALEGFANKGKDLSKEAKSSITSVFLRTGVHNLLDQFGIAGLGDLLNDSKKLASEIATAEANITGPYRQYFLQQAKTLGYYRATEEVVGEFMMMNAHNISKMFDTLGAGKISDADAKVVEAQLNILIPLYALQYSDSSHLHRAGEVLRSELQRTDGNGVEFVLKLHKSLEQEAQQKLFNGNPVLMQFGYTPEITNGTVDVVTVTEAEGKELAKQGYVLEGKVPQDPGNPGDAMFLYSLRGAGLMPYLSGVMSLSGLQAKGSKAHSGYMNTNTYSGAQNASLHASIAQQRQASINRMFTHGASFDPRQQTQNFMAPEMNEQGEVVNWRHLMKGKTRDAVLERDNRFERILGTLAGSVYDKQTSPEQNKVSLKALKALYDSEFKKEAHRYVTVGPKSDDPALRQHWDMLPESAKADARAIFGREGIKVRKDSVTMVFGYRKLSAANMFKEANAQRKQRKEDGLVTKSTFDLDEINMLERIAVAVVEGALTQYARVKLGMTQKEAEDYSQRAAVFVTRGERLWQEVMKETKDNMVVKSASVLLGNNRSNVSQLILSGVSPKEIYTHYLVAMKGATAYMSDRKELDAIRLQLSVGHSLGNEKELQHKVAMLEDAIARNPVTELIDAGLMPSIVEDVGLEDDPYSYKSALATKVDKYTSKLHPTVLRGVKSMYLAHDTEEYQTLSRITQLSDFVARYTLYQHSINRKENPLSKEDAIHEATEAFVFYDTPMHSGLQYLDDMGLITFTKYFLRIQKVLSHNIRDNPTNFVTMLLLDQFVGLGPIVLDSGMIVHIGNDPTRNGPLQYFSSVGNIAPIHATVGLFK